MLGPVAGGGDGATDRSRDSRAHRIGRRALPAVQHILRGFRQDGMHDQHLLGGHAPHVRRPGARDRRRRIPDAQAGARCGRRRAVRPCAHGVQVPRALRGDRDAAGPRADGRGGAGPRRCDLLRRPAKHQGHRTLRRQPHRGAAARLQPRACGLRGTPFLL